MYVYVCTCVCVCVCVGCPPPSFSLSQVSDIDGMQTRCNNSAWLAETQRWMEAHFAEIEPFLPRHGGNVLASQIENEYGGSKSDAAAVAYVDALDALADAVAPELVWMIAMDMDGDGVQKAEFVIGMLVAMEALDQDKLALYSNKFDELDADGSGSLDADDLPALGGLSIADLPTPPTKPPRRAEPAS